MSLKAKTSEVEEGNPAHKSYDNENKDLSEDIEEYHSYNKVNDENFIRNSLSNLPLYHIAKTPSGMFYAMLITITIYRWW